ncbi:LysR family transcriptional regulator [Shewanella amazonensis]|uniref:Substrate-binding transcriptional regulator, LysR family n=1 Tax=Shewanella amazonensis (strain ATCC BAA-1098 / SB2B) TaxID=326297 RepID=A1SBI5_SHEAM|nr:LysR family transcriptional regulator [Shewanella amazonensis]ABM01742.1 substrate-binding transcriptional regulator, LysR family [Shewanella amazonensis SB2B]
MFAHLPSLNGLRVFEAAARHLSFKLAAKELELTPTAVSHQIRNLEAQLEIQLFIRHTRAVELTAAGQTLFDTSRQVLRQIEQTLTNLGVGDETDIHISAPHGFAALWLAQRLPYFQRRFPEVRVSVSQSDAPDTQSGHVAIVPAASPQDATLPEYFGIYASPAYLSRKHSQQTLMHVRRHTGVTQINWDSWQKEYGKFKEAQLIEFDREDQLVQACLAGQGLALTSSLLVSSLVEKGWLKSCLPDKTLPGSGYNIRLQQDSHKKRQIQQFTSWLDEQIGTDADQ